MTHTLANENEGGPEHANLGTGDIFVKKSGKGDEIFFTCQLMNNNGVLKFQTLFPNDEEGDAHNFMHITIGEPNSLTWNAYDTSAGNGANLCRFFIRFVNGPQMFSFLLYGFGGNYELVNVFLSEGSRFFHTERSRPPHPVI